MIDNNKQTKVKILSGKEYLNLMHLTSYDVVDYVLNFGVVAST